MDHYDVLIIGGGAAGFFAGVNAAEKGLRVAIIERAAHFLQKVRLSGGGRCNVTHHCFDPSLLVASYPRGAKELLGPLHRFGPSQTIGWFADRGVTLYAEEDGRMFPTSDSSQTIIDCLMEQVRRHEVSLWPRSTVATLVKEDGLFVATLGDGRQMAAARLILATGSSAHGHSWARHFGHTVVEPIASLFTFNLPASPLLDLSGVTVGDVELSLPELSMRQRGPLLLTHWGFSGPAALKLSAWAARPLHGCRYRTALQVNWVVGYAVDVAAVLTLLRERAVAAARRSLFSDNPFALPRSLWARLLASSGIPSDRHYSALSRVEGMSLAQLLVGQTFQVEGKTTNKEEFVTCGGVSLNEVSFKTMESRKTTGLYFVGEILDIDGITGGFNFQSAWTTAYIAAQACSITSK